MDPEKRLPMVRRALLMFSNRLAETPGRDEDALIVAQLLAEWDGGTTKTGEPRGRSLSIAALRDRIAGVRGAENALEVIDAAIADGAD